jgi:erythromycin esterase
MSYLMNRLLSLTLAALTLGPGISAAEAQGSQDQLVVPGIYRLDGMDPGLPNGDLAPLRQILEGAQVVGLGETFHTSGGYYTMKHRVFRFLVEEMGFRAFGFENPWWHAERTGRYVATCQGTAADAMRGLFGVWQSQETADLLEWMCAWNQAHPNDPLTFFGFDIQQPEADGPLLIDFLRGQGLAEDDPRILGIRQCDSVETSVWPDPVPDSTHQACLQALDLVDQLLLELDPSEAVQTSRADVEWAKISALSLRAWEDEAYYEVRDPVRSYESRDRGMATTFQRIRKLKAGSARTAIWAHNSHIAKQSGLTMGLTTMGTFLDADMGHQYANVALTSAAPEINWRGLFCGPIYVQPSSAERRLQTLGEDFLLVDLDFNGDQEPFLSDTPISIGYLWTLPRQQYDGLIYLHESPMMTPLRWPATCP